MTRLLRTSPAEVWAMLLLVGPMAVVAITRIHIINAHHLGVLPGPNDPDPWLRLVMVREWLMGGDWFSHLVPRTNAPMGGISSPWTRPLDIAIALLVKLQPGHASLTIKLLRAAALVPVVWMMLLLLGLYRAVRVQENSLLGFALLTALIGTAPALWSYYGEGNTDHHALLAALWAWALSCAVQPQPSLRNSWLQGAVLALMLWISPEAMLLIAILYAWPLLRWLKDGTGLLPVVHLTSAVMYGTLLALVIERPMGQWLHPVYDSLSIVYLLLMALCAMAVRILALLPETMLVRCYQRLITAAVVGAGVVAGMFFTYPKFFHGPMVDAAPYIFSHFLPHINEARPLFSKAPLFIAATLFLPVVTLAVYGGMQRVHQPAVTRAAGAQIIYLLLACISLMCGEIRWYYYLFPVTALALAPVLARLFAPDGSWPSRLLTGSEARRGSLRALLVVALVGTPYTLIAMNPVLLRPVAVTQCEAAARQAIRSGELQQVLGDQPLTLFLPTNLSTEVLFFTPYRIIASNYHREAEGIRYVWQASDITNNADMRRYLAQRQVDALLLCPDDDYHARSVLAQWLQHRGLPGWATVLKLPQAHAPLLLKISR